MQLSMIKNEHPTRELSYQPVYWQNEGVYQSKPPTIEASHGWVKNLSPLKQQIHPINDGRNPGQNQQGYYVRAIEPSFYTTYRPMTSQSVVYRSLESSVCRSNVIATTDRIVVTQHSTAVTTQGHLKHCVDCVLEKHHPHQPTVQQEKPKYVQLETPTQRQQSGLKIYSVLLARQGFSCCSERITQVTKTRLKTCLADKQVKKATSITQKLAALKNTAENITKACDYLQGVAYYADNVKQSSPQHHRLAIMDGKEGNPSLIDNQQSMVKSMGRRSVMDTEQQILRLATLNDDKPASKPAVSHLVGLLLKQFE